MGYLKYVNTLQGTKNNIRCSNGNTLPLTQLPFGMSSFAPQTNGANQWWFDPTVPSIEGIRLTHQPSPWINDYGTLLITPQWDVRQDVIPAAWSGYRMRDSEFAPDYINVKFLKSRATLELAPTLRGASVRVRFDEEDGYVSIFNIFGKGFFRPDRENGIIYGATDGNKAGQAKDFKMYFALRPKNDWIDFDKTEVVADGEENAVLHIAVKNSADAAEFDLGISYISYEYALRSCEDVTVEEARELCGAAWEEYLSKIAIKDSDEEVMKTFYSCMYRTGLFPQAAYETDEESRAVHYSPYTGEVHSGVRYTGNGFWDTFRTVLPMYSLIHPELYRDFMLSLLSDYKEGGWIPRWTAMGESGCMPSTLTDSVIAQAILCDIVDRDTAAELLEGMVHHAQTPAPESRFGRNGIEDYLRYGYVPLNHKESVNLTLDFAYSDYCIAQVMHKLGDQREENYRKRAQNYRNIYDSATGFMRAKDSSGKFREPFDPYGWGGDYTEAGAWQTSLFVPHDIEGLAELMGGKVALLARLDEIFESEPLYRMGGYGCEIHEMTEMAISDFGLCSINNQPSFSIPYLYACMGRKDKTEYWIKRMCAEAFNSGYEGYPGDEDNGSMAAWYILSMIGYYPINPGNDQWVDIEASVEGKICGVDIEDFKNSRKGVSINE